MTSYEDTTAGILHDLKFLYTGACRKRLSSLERKGMAKGIIGQILHCIVMVNDDEDNMFVDM